MNLIDRVCRNEGFKQKPYQDTLGVWTIGHGLTYLTRKESKEIVQRRLHDLMRRLIKSKPWFKGCSWTAREIVVHMCFQMGMRGTYAFKDMFAALRKRDYKAAGVAMRDSKWYRQTPQRCERMAKRMEQINA